MAHVSLITLGVTDIGRAERFYASLGWERSTASVDGEVAFMLGGTVVLSLYGRDDLLRDARLEPHDRTGFTGIALAMNVGDEHQVDEALATADRAGGRVIKPAQRAEWGGYSGYFSDPDGHLWEVAHNPGFPLLDSGQVVLPRDR
jgi:uncharacterized protein